MQILLQDLRFAFRQIIRNPGFSLTAVLSLTLGIGATVAVYSILYDAVLHPWPYAGIERICDIEITDSAGHDGHLGPDWTANSPTAADPRCRGCGCLKLYKPDGHWR